MAYYDDLTYKRDEIKKYLNDRVKELKEYSKDEYNTLVKDGELHNEVFNTDYYIIGTYEAKKWLGDQVFDVIGIILESIFDGLFNLYFASIIKLYFSYGTFGHSDLSRSSARFNHCFI